MESTVVPESKEKSIVTKFQKLTKIEKTSFFYGLSVLLLLSWLPVIIFIYSSLGRIGNLVIDIILLVIALAGIIIGIISLNEENNLFTLIGFLSSIIAVVLIAWLTFVYYYIVYL